VTAIHIENVSKRFGKKDSLANVTFDVPSGVVFALLGENGAGKSTLIRGLLGYHWFDSGKVKVLDLDPAVAPLQIRRKVGYVSDTPAFYDWMTPADAGWYAAGFYAVGFLERYTHLVKGFDVPLERRIRDLSKGMRAKVALALAMAFEPSLLILDEPTSGLDPIVRREFLESMVDLAATGQTVFLSSHQIHEVERVADWIAILHQGKLQVVAPLEDLKAEISMLSFSMRDTLIAPQAIDELDIVQCHLTGRSFQCMVRKLPSPVVDSLKEDNNLFDVKVIRPNLEELYIAFTQSSKTSLPWPIKSLLTHAS
jgi:ABC-2 type transport system ATP-binding protein